MYLLIFILNSVFDKDEIEREKQVVIEELKMYEDSPDDLSFDLLTEKIWDNHPLGHRIVGTEETIKAFSREKIINYMSENYTSDRLVVTVAGNINHDDVVKQLEEKLSVIPNKTSSFSEDSVEYTGNIITRYKDIEQLHVCLGTKGTFISDKDRFNYAVLDSILGGGMSSRLFQEIREKKGLAYSIGSYELVYRRAGIFGVYAGISPNNLNELVKSVLFELDLIKEGKLALTDVHRAKEQLKGSLLLSLEAVRNRMMRLARNEIYFHRQITAQEIIDDIEKVNYESIVALANDIFDRKKMSLVTVGPIKESNIDLLTI
jgi:predicted Zn-dependent peptidase